MSINCWHKEHRYAYECDYDEGHIYWGEAHHTVPAIPITIKRYKDGGIYLFERTTSPINCVAAFDQNQSGGFTMTSEYTRRVRKVFTIGPKERDDRTGEWRKL